MHTITLDEEQRQLVLLALANLSLERPGWRYALNEVAKCIPDGVPMFEGFRGINSDVLPISRVAECCAKIVETWQGNSTKERRIMLENIAQEIRQYAADLDKPENMGAAREQCVETARQSASDQSP